MPFYEFECNKCGHRFTQVMSIDDLEAAKFGCPECEGKDLLQVVEPVFVRTARKA
jgi:putative FmdB family regulatory protein